MINQNLLLTGDAGYNLTKSLRFRSSASAYLNRTQGTSTNQFIGTWSFWFKRGTLGTAQRLFEGYTASSDTGNGAIEFGADNCLYVGGWSTNWRITTQVFRDPSAWYHMVVTIDTTQATANNRIKVYVNGTEITAFSTTNNPTQNSTFGLNNNSSVLQIGRRRNVSSNDQFFDGYMAEVNFIDGQALTPSSFGETSTTTGVWIPKKYTGTYGTNGFYLPFTDTTSTSTLGTDFSGNSNTWTVNNISLTSGSTYDSMTDVPTLTDATTANYATLNPLQKGSFANLTNANLQLTGNTSTNSGASIGTISFTSGKFYWELTATTVITTAIGVGATTVQLTSPTLNDTEAYATNYGFYVRSSGSKEGIAGEIQTFTMPSFTTGDVIGIAVDADNGAIYVSKNGSFINSGVPTSGSSKTGSCYNYTPSSTRTIAPLYGVYFSGSGDVGNANFGQRPFAYTPPTGFVALNTFNLPTPTIGATASSQANKYFDINTYTGDGSQTASFTNSGSMQPDLVWSKIRSGTTQGIGVFDSVRGTTGQSLDTSATTVEGTWVGSNASDYGYVSAFNSNGFSVNDGAIATTGGYVNFSGRTYVAWQWRASNATAVTNTAGSITSTVSANTTAGFSIVTYTGNGTSSQTCGHGLGVTPSMVIWKNRNDVDSWIVYHNALTTSEYLVLNTTAAKATVSGLFTGISSTLLPLNNVSAAINANGFNYVAYCFAQVAGYSAFGSYTGNGSTDGPFIFTGFRPRFIMWKRSDSTGDWIIFDTARDTYNYADKQLVPNTSGAEQVTGGGFVREDFLSNGFKVRSTDSYINANGGTYIYMAFAENPFKYSLAR